MGPGGGDDSMHRAYVSWPPGPTGPAPLPKYVSSAINMPIAVPIGSKIGQKTNRLTQK